MSKNLPGVIHVWGRLGHCTLGDLVTGGVIGNSALKMSQKLPLLPSISKTFRVFSPRRHQCIGEAWPLAKVPWV